MDEFLKMDIFFVVTTLVVVILGILVALILFRVYRIMTHIERISQQADEEAMLIRADIAQMRNDLKRGMRWGAFSAFMRKLGGRFFDR
jgi:hypothetical protein